MKKRNEERNNVEKALADSFKMPLCHPNFHGKNLLSFPSCSGCQFPPPSSQTGASLTAVHSPALHNEAESQTPSDASQPLHRDTATPLRKWHKEEVGWPLK